jgi:phage terminase large subunit GpA-like protein
MTKIKKLNEEKSRLRKEMQTIITQKNNVVDMVANGLLSKGEVKARMDKLRTREQNIQTRLESIEAELENMPDPSKVQRLSKLGMQVLHDATTNNPALIFKKSYQWKRNLVELAFAGTDSQKQRLGVYVFETGDKKQPWQIEIRGTLENTLLGLPLDDLYLEDAFHLDPEYTDMSLELKDIRSMVNKVSSFTSALTCT